MIVWVREYSLMIILTICDLGMSSHQAYSFLGGHILILNNYKYILTFRIILVISFINMSLLKESAELTHHSLESFINEITQSSSAIRIHELISHPQISTISNEHQQLINLFVYGNLTNIQNSKFILNNQQLHQLRKITIVDLFEGQYVSIKKYRK